MILQEILLLMVVTPFMGVWIEIQQSVRIEAVITVTPFMGVWIEILDTLQYSCCPVSHTLYGCVD